jgi:hypothetical protein
MALQKNHLSLVKPWTVGDVFLVIGVFLLLIGIAGGGGYVITAAMCAIVWFVFWFPYNLPGYNGNAGYATYDQIWQAFGVQMWVALGIVIFVMAVIVYSIVQSSAFMVTGPQYHDRRY